MSIPTSSRPTFHHHQAFVQAKDLWNFVWLVAGLLLCREDYIVPCGNTASIPQQEDLAVCVVEPALTSRSSPLRGFFLWMIQEMLNTALSQSPCLFLSFFIFFSFPPLPLPLEGFLWGKESGKGILFPLQREGRKSAGAQLRDPRRAVTAVRV